MAFTPIDDDTLGAFGEHVSTELFQTLADNIAYLTDSIPVGSIVPILDGINGCPAPNSDIWVLCDGSTISNADSPLNGQTTPDLVGQNNRVWLKISASGSVGLFTGESGEPGPSNDAIPFSHNHTVPSNLDPHRADAKSGTNNFEPAAHTHTVTTGGVTADTGPSAYRVNFYMKVL